MDNKRPPRIESLRVQNYRTLRNFELKNISPLTVFIGPNGSGKTTVLDVFAFLADCFTIGLCKAWDSRGRFRELRTRGQTDPITIEIKYREQPQSPLITYHLSIDEAPAGPVVAREWLQWRRGSRGGPFRFLDFKHGSGMVIVAAPGKESSGEERIEETLDSPDLLAVSVMSQLARNPRISALRRFVTSWHLSSFAADRTRRIPEAGMQERLSLTGDNLLNVIQYLKAQHPDRLQKIVETLVRWVPRLQKVGSEILLDDHIFLRIKDSPLEQPVLARHASGGTLKILAYLTLLYSPDPPQLIGVEALEKHLHPRLLPELAEESRLATVCTQLMVTTHSPFFVNGLRPEEVWVLYRDKGGFTQAKRTADISGVPDFIEAGALLGYLWMEGHLGMGALAG